MLAVSAVIVVAFYLLAVTPVRTYFQQQAQMKAAEHRYEMLASTNKQLEERAAELQSDAEIMRLARERYELVEPGQMAFAVMPPSPAVLDAAPKTQEMIEMQAERSWPERIWNAINPWS